MGTPVQRQRRLDGSFRTSGHVCIPTWRHSCIAEFYGGPRALVLRASTCCAGLDRTLASIVGCCWWPRLRFLRTSMPDFAHLQHTWLSFISLSQPSPSIQLSQRRACRLSPLVPPRIHDHWLRFLCLPTGRTNSADILWTPRARPVGALRILDSACSFVVCKLGLSCVSTHRLHSSIALFVRGPLAPL